MIVVLFHGLRQSVHSGNHFVHASGKLVSLTSKTGEVLQIPRLINTLGDSVLKALILYLHGILCRNGNLQLTVQAFAFTLVIIEIGKGFCIRYILRVHLFLNLCVGNRFARFVCGLHDLFHGDSFGFEFPSSSLLVRTLTA